MIKNFFLIISLLSTLLSCSTSTKIELSKDKNSPLVLYFKGENKTSYTIPTTGLIEVPPCFSCSREEEIKNALLFYEQTKKENPQKKIIFLGEYEGSLLASEVSFKLLNDAQLVKLIFLGVISRPYKEILHSQMTLKMTQDFFRENDFDNNKKISIDEIPEKMKGKINISIPFSQGDFLRLLEKQYQHFLTRLYASEENRPFLNRTTKWYKDIFEEKTLIEKAASFSKPIVLLHFKEDTYAPYNLHAFSFYNQCKQLKKGITLIPLSTHQDLELNYLRLLEN